MADSQRKTVNLFSSSFTDGYSLNANGLPQAFEGRIATLVPIAINAENCTLSYRTSKNTNFMFAVISSGTLVRRVAGKSNGDTIDTSGGDTLYICIYESLGQGIEASEVSEIMLNEGETALPYEPYSSTGWLHSLRKLTTATDTLTTLPADIYADGTTATVGLKGNMYQASGVSPDNPIQPSETGEKSANLFDKDNAPDMQLYTGGNNTIMSAATAGSTYIVCKPNTSYTIKKKRSARFVVALTNDVPANGVSFHNGITNNEGTSIQITTDTTAKYIFIFYYVANYDTDTEAAIRDTIFVYEGVDDKNYEPYGYKLTISSASTTTPVYLGEVESARKIKKLVLTGTEDWIYQSDYNRYLITISDAAQFVVRQAPMLCSHYQVIDDGRPISDVPNNSVYFNNQYLCITTTDQSSKTDFNNYLAAQYANGTPVCVWYVLATEETAVVNEPLRKIGDYADTVSGITIPTITGADNFDVETTLKPSEVELTYTGWHDTYVKEKSENLVPTNISDYSQGSISPSTGENTESTTRIRTNDYYPIEEDTDYYITVDDTNYCFLNLSLFDNNKQFLGSYYTINGMINGATSMKINIDSSIISGTKYFRAILRKADSTDITPQAITTIKPMINLGSTAQTYEPYWK